MTSNSKSSRLSRLLRSSIEAFQVAVDHYTEGTPKGNKACVESCDKANELILKAKVQDLGESIEVKTRRGPEVYTFMNPSISLGTKKG